VECRINIAWMSFAIGVEWRLCKTHSAHLFQEPNSLSTRFNVILMNDVDSATQ